VYQIGSIDTQKNMMKRRTMTKRGYRFFTTGCIVIFLLMALLAGCTKDGTNKSSSTGTEEDLVITLERTACFGACPVYSLTINGDGTVIYVGEDFVKTKGERETTIGADAVNQLVLEFEKADYFSLNDSYTGFGVSDMPSANTSITVGGQTKAVKHYLGDRSAPEKLTELENKIDEIVNSAQWIK
jgi:hypothetical protein